MHDARGAGGARRGSLTFIGTATVVLRLGPFTILTDPNFLHQGDHAKLGYGLRSRRLTEPACSIADLPPLDAVVLSHHHGDHFDDVAAAELPRDLPIVTTPHAARKLRRQGFTRPVPLQRWQSHELVRDGHRLTVTALPGRHAPGPLHAALPPVMGSLLELDGGSADEAPTVPLRTYITGDTLYYDDLAEIGRRHPAIDLCVLHLGGTRILGVLLTMDAVQGVRLLRLLTPAVAVPVHHDDYTVFRSPLEDFRRELATADLVTEVREVARGETIEFSGRTV